MRLGAFLDDGLAQPAVIQHAVDIEVVARALDVHVKLGIDVQGLGGASLVFEDADAGVERKPGKDDAACGHDENLGGTAGIAAARPALPAPCGWPGWVCPRYWSKPAPAWAVWAMTIRSPTIGSQCCPG
ncbi:hypothetical protein G6F40_014531 [Rhizopus arrhizus]|nr:hypothetical protein G6F40_014531 [Rhizopus arrhizus]